MEAPSDGRPVFIISHSGCDRAEGHAIQGQMQEKSKMSERDKGHEGDKLSRKDVRGRGLVSFTF